MEIEEVIKMFRDIEADVKLAIPFQLHSRLDDGKLYIQDIIEGCGAGRFADFLELMLSAEAPEPVAALEEVPMDGHSEAGDN